MYPLVMTVRIAIEAMAQSKVNGYFPSKMVDLSIVLLIYQRVSNKIAHRMPKLLGHGIGIEE